MMMKSRAVVLICVLLVTVVSSYGQTGRRLPFTKGVYGNPEELIKDGASFSSLGINAIFVRSSSLDDELYSAARKDDIRVYIEFPTLNGEDYLDEHPEAWPLNERGERAPAADWFMGVCLSDSGFIRHREQQLRAVLKKYPVDGVWLDYVHWHAQFETPQPILPETCFCDRCVSAFKREKSVHVVEGDVRQKAQWILSNSDSLWRVWRSETLTEWMAYMKSIVREERPRAMVGIYYCPWYPADYDSALYKTLGIDMVALAGVADVLSPMLYHQMMERSTDWVSEYVQWLGDTIVAGKRRPLIWPIVQAHNKPGIVTVEEFRSVMWNGSRAPATGIMMFTVNTMVNEPAKLEVMRDLYRKRR